LIICRAIDILIESIKRNFWRNDFNFGIHPYLHRSAKVNLISSVYLLEILKNIHWGRIKHFLFEKAKSQCNTSPEFDISFNIELLSRHVWSFSPKYSYDIGLIHTSVLLIVCIHVIKFSNFCNQSSLITSYLISLKLSKQNIIVWKSSIYLWWIHLDHYSTEHI